MTDKELIQRIASEQPLPPPGFEARQEHLLSGLMGKEGMKMKKKMSAALILALALFIALTAVAVAEISGFSILSFLESKQALTPEAEKLIQAVDGKAETIPGMAEASVKETLFDGRSAMVTLEIRPLRDDIFLIPDCGEEMSIDFLIPGAGDGFAADYARERGMQLYSVLVSPADDLNADVPYVDYYDGRIAEDGTLTLIARATLNNSTEGFDFHMKVRLIPCIWAANTESLKAYYSAYLDKEQETDEEPTASPLIYDFENASECELTARLEKGSVRWRAHSKEEISFPTFGVTVTDITAEGYALTTLLKITCKVTDAEAFEKTDNGLWFNILDDNGVSMWSDLDNGGVTFPDENGVFTQTDSLIALDTAPETLHLHAFNCWEKEIFEDKTVELIPQ